MSQNILSLLINLIAAAIGGASVWGWRKFVLGRRRHERLLALRRAASEGEVALCVRVGGGGDPVPDVLKFLREKQPSIKRLIVYRISAEEAGHRLDEPEVSNRIIKDLYDIVRAYGEGEVSRVHFFPAGMVTYPLVFGMMLNWCTVVVYYQSKGSYVPLYELDKEWIYKRQHEFKSFKNWEMLDTRTDLALPASPNTTPVNTASFTTATEVTKGL
jgi:hypothetical protein